MCSRPLISTGGEDAGDGGAGQDRVDGVAVGEQHVEAAQHVGGNHVQRDRCVFEPLELEVLGQQLAQAAVGDEVAALAQEPEQSGEGAGGEHVRP